MSGQLQTQSAFVRSAAGADFYQKFGKPPCAKCLKFFALRVVLVAICRRLSPFGYDAHVVKQIARNRGTPNIRNTQDVLFTHHGPLRARFRPRNVSRTLLLPRTSLMLRGDAPSTICSRRSILGWAPGRSLHRRYVGKNLEGVGSGLAIQRSE